MIYTVTFNPSLDYIVAVDDFRPGLTNRASSELMLPGGKGINVSIVLHNLGIESTALGFTAGFVGEEIRRRLQGLGIREDFIPIREGNSRINVKLKSIDGTEINGLGPKIGGDEAELLMKRLDTLTEGDVLFLAGSIPASMPDDIYSVIMRRIAGRGVVVVVDASRDLLVKALEYHPFLVKPNHHELGEIFGVTLHSRDEVIPYGQKLREMGAQNVLISMAGEGAVLVAADGSVWQEPAPVGKLINGVGAGDSMTAGFMAGWMERMDYEHAFHMGIAAGSASAFSETFCTKAEVETLYKTSAFGEKAAKDGKEADSMKIYSGKSVYGGIAIGRIRVCKKNERPVRREQIGDPDKELERYERAKAEAMAQLRSLYEKALKEVGEVNAAIFEMHRMMLEDGDYNESVEHIVRTQQVNAEYAVASTGDNFAGMFAEMEDDYMRERAADVKDISERLLAVLTGDSAKAAQPQEPVIIAADDLTPSETVQLDKDKVLSFVTVHGAANSHTAILARTMGIPALIGTDVPLEAIDGKLGIVDGMEGRFYVEPDEKLLSLMREKQQAETARKEMLQSLKGKENVTIDGRKVMLYANIGNVKDLPEALQNDAGGIGLFRSEFLYLKSDDYPTEEEQFQVYKTVAETMAGRRAIIRTMDIGADKKCEYFGLEAEENPALGYRGIRICLTQTDVFKTQLRALFRASAFGNLAIMYPMIISVEEIRRIQQLVAEVKQELTASRTPFGEPEQGIMIETPAAVMISGELAREVDFFSIGTNDLTQYALAIDRQNPKLDAFYEAHHPAVLRMISMVVECAHREGIWVGICGELGADTELTEEFLRMGVDELSVSPNDILPVRRRIREINLGA